MTPCPETAARIAEQIASDRAAAVQAAEDAAWAATIPEPIRRQRARVSQAQLGDFYGLTAGLPDYVRKPLLARWHRIRKTTENGALSAANGFVRDFVASARAASDNLPLAMADDELASYARTNAEECGRIIAEADAGEVRSILIEGKLCRQPRFVLEALIKAIDAGVLPDLVRMGPKALEQLPKRLADEKWWRGRLKRFVTRAVEQLMVRLGCVDRERAAYLSEGSFKRMLGRDQRNAKALALAEATNEKGQTYTLAELSRRTVANPAIRRTELMVRVRGTEEVMVRLGYEGYFLTITAPSRYHRCSDKYGKGSPEFSPRDTQDYLCENWAECRALFKKKAHQIQVYGVRVVEPHHDGTPHWHMLIWVAPHQSERMLHILREKALEVDGDEPGARFNKRGGEGARFKVEKIDPRKGSAVGYIAKYLAKNIDGEFVGTDDESGLAADTGARRVNKWASLWRIRQFQLFGQPPVTVWRELRKADLFDEENQGELILRDLHSAADLGDWAAFLTGYGRVGAGLRIGFEPLLKSDKATGEHLMPLNKYGEPQFVRKGVAVFDLADEVIERIKTRMHEWDVKWGRDNSVGQIMARANAAPLGVGFERSGEAASTWTRVNNCNRSDLDNQAQRDLLAKLDAENARIHADNAAQIASPEFKAALNRLAARDRHFAHRGRSHTAAMADLAEAISRIEHHSPNGAERLRDQHARLQAVGADAYDVRP
ncbi:replication endonuclease [Jeongeupia chitinilytica]|uniref:Replication gene A protein-like domain-containing protein n=1 Tax=Jeongeupia chitinilytica TaxID=1041641 RepID=A0ABQ3GZ36_9NEIS|nr:replication endonuclease [Jeongeupia chitinilytica]GHD59779.1 hypothetical protein GCM10007350_11510 [Jeongeupia chitinilytica]